MGKWRWLVGVLLLAVLLWIAGDRLHVLVFQQELANSRAWRNLKELYWPISSAIAMTAFAMSVQNQRRQLRARRVDQTAAVIRRYNDTIRQPVNDFVANGRKLIAADRMIQGDAQLTELQKNNARYLLARDSILPDAVHFLDEIGFYFRYSENLHLDQLYATTASEISRLLLDAELMPLVAALLRSSSLINVAFLQQLLLTMEANRYVHHHS